MNIVIIAQVDVESVDASDRQIAAVIENDLNGMEFYVPGGMEFYVPGDVSVAMERVHVETGVNLTREDLAEFKAAES